MLELFLSTKTIISLKRMTYRQITLQALNAIYSIIGTYMIWKFIGILANNDSPIVVVLSESMSPGFERGDILFLTPKDYNVGDIVVFQVYKNEIPIVHRAIKKYGSRVLTKGDNNLYSDESLYRRNQYMLNPEDILSCVYGNLPYFGMITIWVNTLPFIKYMVLLITGLRVFFDREE
ncbi:signal peptidase I [Anncaliia algerae PRA109]|nr:signal peptidase I [Anncaliia algerae PRA109]